jgi:hypothetical protein
VQTLGDLERPAEVADVLAEDEHTLVALHLLVQRLCDRIEERDRLARRLPRLGAGVFANGEQAGRHVVGGGIVLLLGPLERLLDLVGDPLLEFGSPLLVQQPTPLQEGFEPWKRILRHPRLALVGLDVLGRIVTSVAEVPEGDRLDEGRSLAAPRPIDGFLGRRVALEDIVAVDHHAGDPVSVRPMGDELEAELAVVGSGIGVLVVLNGEHDRQAQHRCHVDRLMPGAGCRRAFTAVGESDAIFTPLLEGEGTAGGDRVSIGQRRHDHESPLGEHPEVCVPVAPPGWRRCLAIEVEQRLFEGDSLGQLHPDVTVGGPEDVVIAESGGEPDLSRLLADAGIHRTRETPTPIHRVQAGFEQASGEHQLVQLEETVVGQFGGVAFGLDGRRVSGAHA